MTKKKKTEFGWVAVFRHYGICPLLQDCILPGILSAVIIAIIIIYEADVREQLKNLLNVGFMIVPVMISLVLAAYAILLSYLLSDSISRLVEDERGKRFVAGLNSGFAAYLLFSVIAIVLMIIISCLLNMEIEFMYEDIVNMIVYYILCFLLLYSVNVLVGVIIDIFNIGQTRIL